MTKIKLELLSSKPLLLSHRAQYVIAKTLEEHEIKILKRDMNNNLQLRLSFERQKEKLRKKIDDIKQKAKRTKESEQPEKEMTLGVFKNVLKSARAEAYIASKTFLLTIARTEVAIETRAEIVTEASLFYLQSYFRLISAYVCEAYAEIGENVSLTEKYGNLFEKLAKHNKGELD